MFYKYNTFNRPISPHLTIYIPFDSSVLSIWHRFTGILLIITLFFILISLKLICVLNIHFFLSYLLITETLNFFLAILFLILFYHLLNGIRHIIWDFGILLTNKKVIFSSFFLIGNLFLLFLLNFWKL